MTTATYRRNRFAELLIVVGAMLLLAASIVFVTDTTARAASVSPQFVAGNPSCTGLGYDFGFKPQPEPPPSGTYTFPGLTDTVTITSDGVYFDWSATLGIDAVIAKGGPNANVYVYDPPTEAFSDTELHSPINPNNQQPFGLSHIEFCYDIEEPATLTLTKRVINDDTGTAGPGDFEFFVTPDGGAAMGPYSSGDVLTLDPGDYVVSETPVPGYTAGPWGGDCAADGSITLVSGIDHECTIDNDDIPPPELELTKVVVNDDGGSAVAGDFEFFVTPDGGATMGPYSSGDLITLEPGDYVVSETPIDGYTAGDWGGDCAADGSITLEEGDEAECTIENDDDPEEVTTTTVLPPEEPTTTTTSTTQAPATTGAATTTTSPTEEPTELPATGAGSFLVLMLAGLGMATLGAGLVLLGTSRRRQAWVV